MNSRRLLQQAFCLTVVALLLAGCGGTPVEPTSAPTSVPPTETPTPIPPTVIPTVAPNASLTGRLLFTDSEEPVADTSVFITGEEGTISFESGVLVNPTGKTDSTGRFKIELPEEFLKKQDYQIMVLVSLKGGLNPTNKLVPLTNQDGTYAVFQINSVPSENDLGDVLVQK